ncbi:PIH1-domain-containing protein [Rhizoclosmatium globosum]|uniref:PIH1-domain-containing protein n=1 Tax=Rhizoclosmatium globosum TaxID=329046 RepID=A0A1Y2CV24_9FUNG|nr:PIH1-domain-containing protein [Rhizoclosmatium globosum]|eukprot:ORY50863.1 PIH1-domain-containing protein [Rhizoclosmatium globosum]
MPSTPGTESSFEKLDVTQEEMERISKAMKDEKFRELFKEYMDEISDPKNREVTIITRIQTPGNNIRWVKPTPGRVLKTSFAERPPKQVAGPGAEELEIPAEVKKVFVNICSCPEIEEAKAEGSRKDERGQPWSIPYSLTPGRVDMDKAGGKCFVYDCVFNPKTFEKGCAIPQFMELLLVTAIEGIERQFSVKLDRETPQQTPTPLQTPTYTLTHRQSVSYQNYLASRDRSLTTPPRPTSLILKIQLPLCDSAAGLSLNIINDGWTCHVKMEGRYELFVDLGFEVVEKEGTAKFDKGRRELVVEVPCVPAPVESLPEIDAPLEVDEVETKETEVSESIEEPAISLDEDIQAKHEETEFPSDGDNKPQFSDIPEIQLNDKPFLDPPELQINSEPLIVSDFIPSPAQNITDEEEVNSSVLPPSRDTTIEIKPESNMSQKTVEPSAPPQPQSQDPEMEEDLFTALQNLKPAVPTESELTQLTESAKKAGILKNANEALWRVKSVEEVGELEELANAAEVEKPVSAELKLVSHLIYELDE